MRLKSIVSAAFVIGLSLFAANEADAQVNVRIGPARHHRVYRRPIVRERVVVRERPVVRERVIVRERPAHRHYYHRRYR